MGNTSVVSTRLRVRMFMCVSSSRLTNIICIYRYPVVVDGPTRRQGDAMAKSIDLRAVSGCTCLRARRIARQLTQAYDGALGLVGLTVNQFGVLAKLYGATRGGQASLPIGALAGRLGMHPTTLNPDPRPLPPPPPCPHSTLP